MGEKKENVKRQSSQYEKARWLGPVLDALRDLGSSGRTREVIEKVAVNEKVSDQQREKLLKDGRPEFDNHIRWARVFLFHAGLLDNSPKGIWLLTKTGQETHLDIEQSQKIIKAYLENRKKKDDEAIEDVVQIDEVDTFMDSSLLEILKKVNPKKFESLCKLLLREHGFDDVRVTQYSRDGGIDGFGKLYLNPLVSMSVAFQCKRYDGAVSRSEIDDFRGSVLGQAERMIFITTGHFSEDAKRSANRPGTLPVELIDGQQLVELFEESKLGLIPKTVYEIDSSFFEQYM